MSDWKYGLDEVGPEAEENGRLGPPIEPDRPSIENVIPFVAGMVLAVYIFLQVL